ncbi:Ubiquitin carboxyl-terminal hydrolase 46 [Papilio xuthus]|uniref:Ubiquitin carboxyl-terminal hydrolase n=1 Tax=Papilio xuthus TaxID=66420 RepID=A0A194PLD9_PAPXU|nr:Ubiquitin carboxyl-terminal hydrolase 46 [Papilio xuthus]
MDKESNMEEIKVNESGDGDEATWAIVNFVSHEVTVESHATPEMGIPAGSSNQNLTTQDTQDNEEGEKDENTKQDVAGAVSDAAIIKKIKEINKEMDHLAAKLSKRSSQSVSPAQNAEQGFQGTSAGNEKQNIVNEGAGPSFLTINQEYNKMYNFEGPSEWGSRSVSPNDLIIVENDSSDESEVERTETEKLYESNCKRIADLNTPSTSRGVSNDPPVIVRSVQKVFPTVHSNVNEIKDNVATSLSQITLGNASFAYTSNRNIVSAGLEGVLPGNEHKIYTIYPARNIAKIEADFQNFLPQLQYSRMSNYNRRTGLTNYGSTCYINSVIQALLVTNKFSTYTVLKMYQYQCWCGLAELFGNMMYNICPVANPLRFYSTLRSLNFNVYREHDASEFLLYLLKTLMFFEPNWEVRAAIDNAQYSVRNENTEAENYYPSADSSQSKRQKTATCKKMLIDNLFGAVITTNVTCQMCQTVSSINETVYMLHLSFSDANIKEVVTVENLLKEYFSAETLSGVNSYACNTCYSLREAEKISIVAKTPKYLILTLKNFRYIPARNISEKKMHKIKCDDIVTLVSKNNQKYRSTYILYAMIVHSGKYLNTGHYIAFTKCNDQWYKINDKKVSAINHDEINKLEKDETPYILFYRRTDIEEGEFPKYEQIPWFTKIQDDQIEAPRGFFQDNQ